MRIVHGCNAAFVLQLLLYSAHIRFISIIDERSTPMGAIKASAQASQFPGIRFLNSFGRALNARDAFNEVSLMNDSELSKRGLDRNSIFKHVLEKLGY